MEEKNSSWNKMGFNGDIKDKALLLQIGEDFSRGKEKRNTK